VIAEYAYDPLGRRFKKVTSSETLYYYYSDEGLVGEYNSSGSPVRQYAYVPDSTWSTNPLFQKTSRGYAYYRNDHLGTPQQIIGTNGAKVWEGEYRAFGGIKSELGAWENRFRFPGQYFDQETANYYNYFRTYDPAIGRYLESDPIGQIGGINTYVYANANPNLWIDPTGEIVIAALGMGIISGLINMAVNDHNTCVEPWEHFLAGFAGGVAGVLTGGLGFSGPVIGLVAGGLTGYMNANNSPRGVSSDHMVNTVVLGAVVGAKVAGFWSYTSNAVIDASNKATGAVAAVTGESVGTAILSPAGLGCKCN
jgi:RHS repeat-associated protein